MLIKFKVGNYLSFKDEVELCMEPSSIREYADDNIAPGHNLLKSAVLYGANSSGKSNLLKAIAFMKKFIIESSKDKQANEKIEVERFKLSTETETTPSHFEVEFFCGEIKYRYGFEVDINRVHGEWLYFTEKIKEYACFVREKDTITLYDPSFQTQAQGLETRTRINALFLSVVAQFNGATATDILHWFENLKFISDLQHPFNISYTARLIEEDNSHSKAIHKFLVAADLGFKEVISEKLQIPEDMGLSKEIKEYLFFKNKPARQVNTLHFKYDANKNSVGEVQFDLTKNESLGTQKYFSMAGYIVDALMNSTVLVIDELDSRLHPALSSLIVKLFNCKNNNKENAQLIFATQNTNLLSKKILRRDQILLTTKSLTGATAISALSTHDVRSDEAFEKHYLQGDYGAIPHIKELNIFEN
jgi:hypothetical protein